ncbi:helix-turn-helix domain-containing protein [Actinosynnema sp. NPDC051121]|nr:TetR/AcrR family transcriptional regulator [Saccharothrix sp.]
MNSDARERALAAGLEVFGRHGFRQTSMALVAEAAGMSRPALYQHFKNKEEVFRAVGERLVADLVAAAGAAARESGPTVDRLCRVLSVKVELTAPTVAAARRRELFAEANGIAPELPAAFRAGVVAVLADVLAEAGLPDADTAALLFDAATGIALEPSAPDEQTRRLRRLVELVVGGSTRHH